MLDKIRTAAGTKFAQLILALITIPFALWGVESYLRSSPGQDVVASVAGQKVTTSDFDQAIRQQQERFRGMLGANYDPQMMDTPQMRESVLDDLINQKLVVAAASKVGVAVSDAALAERIAVEPAFQQDGKFSVKAYEAALRSAGFTPARYESALRADIERSEFQGALVGTAFAGTAPATTLLNALEQTRDVAVVNLTPDQYAAKVKVDGIAAKAYYESHKPDFSVPEQAKVEYVELSIDSIAAQSPVLPDEVKQAYDDQKNTRYIQPEQRRASHILIPVPPKADDAAKKAAREKADKLFADVKKNPKTFAEVAKANSSDQGSAVQGGDLGFFGHGAMVKPFEDAAFAAKKGDIVGPVQTEFGYHIIMVTDIHAEKVKTLAEAAPEIEADLKKTKASKRYAEVAQIFSDKVFEQSTSLKPIADELKLQVRTSDWISKGGGVPPLNNPKLNAAIFSNEALHNKRNTEAVEVGPNMLVAAHVVDSKPATQRPFEVVEQDIIRRLTREEGAKLAKADGEAKLKAAQAGKPADLAWPASLAVGRQNPGGLPPNVITQVLKADVRKLPAYVGVDNPQGGYTVVQISKVNSPPAVDDAKMKSLRQRLEQTVAQQEMQSLLDALRKDEGVKVSKELIEKKPAN